MWVVIAQEDSQPLPPSDFRDLHSTGTWGKKVNTPKLADRLLSSYLHPLLKSEFEKKKARKKTSSPAWRFQIPSFMLCEAESLVNQLPVQGPKDGPQRDGSYQKLSTPLVFWNNGRRCTKS